MDYRHDQFTRARNQFDQQFSQPHGLHMRTMDYQQEQFSFPGHRRETRQIQRGSQPIGSMVHRQEQFTLPGYEEHGTILIQYTFSGGLQGPEHPNPGQRYDGTSRSAYLPDNPEGRQVLKLLIKAFDAGLVFKIGRSMTSRMDNQIIWADIPHKTCRTGGPSK
jgi:deltex-like protein